MKAVILHNVTGSTRVAVFEAPIIARQILTAGFLVELRDEIGAPPTGDAYFHPGGLVMLIGDAIDQYGSLTRPTENDGQENEDV